MVLGSSSLRQLSFFHFEAVFVNNWCRLVSPIFGVGSPVSEILSTNTNEIWESKSRVTHWSREVTRPGSTRCESSMTEVNFMMYYYGRKLLTLFLKLTHCLWCQYYFSVTLCYKNSSLLPWMSMCQLQKRKWQWVCDSLCPQSRTFYQIINSTGYFSDLGKITLQMALLFSLQ